MRIWNASLKRVARGSLEMRDAKNSQKVAICAPSYNFVGLYHIDNRKKLVKQQYLLQMSPQYGERRPTSG